MQPRHHQSKHNPNQRSVDFACVYEDYTYINKNFSGIDGQGGLYSVVFQYCLNGDGDYDVYYAMTGLVVPSWDHLDRDPPDDVSFDINIDNELSHLGTVKTVPEPATMSLLGLGALAMVLRRKLRK